MIAFFGKFEHLVFCGKLLISFNANQAHSNPEKRELGSLLEPIEEQHKTTATDGTFLTTIKNLETESLEDICEEGRPAPWEECLDDP